MKKSALWIEKNPYGTCSMVRILALTSILLSSGSFCGLSLCGDRFSEKKTILIGDRLRVRFDTLYHAREVTIPFLSIGDHNPHHVTPFHPPNNYSISTYCIRQQQCTSSQSIIKNIPLLKYLLVVSNKIQDGVRKKGYASQVE